MSWNRTKHQLKLCSWGAAHCHLNTARTHKLVTQCGLLNTIKGYRSLQGSTMFDTLNENQFLHKCSSTEHSQSRTFRFRSARTNYRGPSDPQARRFWKPANVIWNLLVSALSVSALSLSGIRYLPTCGISPPLCHSSKLTSSLSCLDCPFHRWRLVS